MARTVLKVVCAVVLALTVFGRLASGVHWFTDILGGVLISITLLSVFEGVIDEIRARRRQKHKK